nr:hypothetical protein CFP56_50076 [Quercus suber]
MVLHAPGADRLLPPISSLSTLSRKDHPLQLLSKWDFVFNHFVKVLHQRLDWMLLWRIAASNIVEIMATAYLQCCGILDCCK